jgi:hypothetical protein
MLRIFAQKLHEQSPYAFGATSKFQPNQLMPLEEDWTRHNKGDPGYHKHTSMVTDHKPTVRTERN